MTETHFLETPEALEAFGETLPARFGRGTVILLVGEMGGENESRVSSFLFQYTKDILASKPVSVSTVQTAFGKVRNSLWNAGRYNVDIHEAWPLWIRSTLPGGTGALPSAPSVSYTATKNLAINNYMDTSRIP